MLEQLGLVEVLRDTTKDFAERTGVPVKLECGDLTAGLTPDTELALYRILQEAFKNVEKHARARHVTVSLTQQAAHLQLLIKDDGIGFNLGPHPTGKKKQSGLGLLGMRERATYVGGSFE